MCSLIRLAMKPTDFSKYLSGFLTGYLAHERGASKNTIYAYRDAFVLFIGYMAAQGTPINRLTLEAISQSAVIGFLDWLQAEQIGRASGRGRVTVRVYSE